MRILFITLSNVGDCILTLPVLDALMDKYPDAEFSVVCSARAKEVFDNNCFIKEIIFYDKKTSLSAKLRFVWKLRKNKYDLVADLRDTILPYLLGAKRITRLFTPFSKGILHMRDRHLKKLKIKNEKLKIKSCQRHFFINSNKEYEKYKEYIVVAPGARSHLKRWNTDGFAQICDKIIREGGISIILAGDSDDKAIGDEIISKMNNAAINLAGKTTLRELASLINGAKLVISCDSAAMHLASYLNKPVIAIFGPTNEKKYGPWSQNCAVVKKEVFCRPCEKAQCRFKTMHCISLIKPEEALRAVYDILAQNAERRMQSTNKKFKRILIVRTDRIGDVVLSTPVITAMRDNFPNAYIAMMVNPVTCGLVRGNPYLDEVIIYDKDNAQKGIFSSIKFAVFLRKKKFDLAVILHSTNRVNLITYLAGIKERIGYSRRLGFLLTKNIPYIKHKGEKHEIEYNLDLIRQLGLSICDAELYIPIDAQSEKWAKEVFKDYGLKEEKDNIVVLHPSASCQSRMWPIERFAQVAKSLITKYYAKIIVVSSANDTDLTKKLSGLIGNTVINLGGKTTLMQLASILRRSSVMISSDSGPVHIAVACGLAVVVLFGRAQPGLGPKRWGPRGKDDIVLHKKTKCVVCLAHECKDDFACLKSITVEDVLSAVDDIFKLC